MPGFFLGIRSYFDAKHSGKYLALLLSELARREPRTFARIFDLPRDVSKALQIEEMQVACEWSFETRDGRKRRADLALLSAGEPILLVEVKEDDFRNPNNTEQVADYISMLGTAPTKNRRRPLFVHVSRFSPVAKDQEELARAVRLGKPVRLLRYRGIYEALSGRSGPVGDMLRDYLEDIGVASYSGIDLEPEQDGKSVAFLLTQVLGFPHRHGLRRLHSDRAITEVPALFKKLFGNLEVIGEWVKNANPLVFRNRFTRKFRPETTLDFRALQRGLEKIQHEEGELSEGVLPGNGSLIRSGTVTFYTQGKFSSPAKGKVRLGSNDWLYVELGFVFEISKGSLDADNAFASRAPQVYLYASFYGRGLDEATTYSKPLRGFPNEKRAFKELRACLDRALRDALAASSNPERAALHSFKLPPAG
jgi:hypothetical protein